MRISPLATLILSLLFSCGGDAENNPTPAAKTKAKAKESTEPTAQSVPDPERPAALTAENTGEPDPAEEADPIPAATAVPTDGECAASLAAIQAQQNSQIDAGMGDPLATAGWVPSSAPGAEARDWSRDPVFDTLGWNPTGQVHGSYKITTSGTDYTVRCITDLDGDGTQATWTVGSSGDPIRTTDEGVR